MLNTSPESLIFLKDVPSLPQMPSRDGRRISLGTIYRWMSRGVAGRRLKAVRVGGSWATRQSWLDEFFGQPTEAMSPAPSPTTRQRQAEINNAKQRLAAAGL